RRRHTRFSRDWSSDVCSSDLREIAPKQYSVTDAGVIEARLPEEPCLLTVALWLEAADGAIRARNYVNVDVDDGRPAPAVERTERSEERRVGKEGRKRRGGEC